MTLECRGLAREAPHPDIALSEFRGYETWEDVTVSQTDTGIKVLAANDAMIEAYRDGAPRAVLNAGTRAIRRCRRRITFSKHIQKGERGVFNECRQHAGRRLTNTVVMLNESNGRTKESTYDEDEARDGQPRRR